MKKSLLKEFTEKLQYIEDQLKVDKPEKNDDSGHIEAVDLELDMEIKSVEPDYSYSYAMSLLTMSESGTGVNYADMIRDTCSDDEIKKLASDIDNE